MPKKSVLFICMHNAARSQMAEGWTNQMLPETHAASSAGTRPGAVHPLAVRAMAEARVDVSKHRSKGLEEFAGHGFDYLVTLCSDAEGICPFFPDGSICIRGSRTPPPSKGARRIGWPPSGRSATPPAPGSRQPSRSERAFKV